MNPPRTGSSRIGPRACAITVLAALALAGCGGGSSRTDTRAAARTGGSTPGPKSLVGHLPPTTAFPQVHPIGLPKVISSPTKWATRGGLPGTPGQRDGARLSKLGFVAGRRFARISTSNVPGSRGYSIRQPGRSSDAIIFAAGPYFYLIQSIVPAGSPNPVTLRQLRTAAAGWYRRLT